MGFQRQKCGGGGALGASAVSRRGHEGARGGAARVKLNEVREYSFDIIRLSGDSEIGGFSTKFLTPQLVPL